MLSWGAAFRLALVASANSEASILHPHAVFGEWAPTSLRGVAGHFWGLSSAYAELDDRGRAYAMKALSRKLFAVHEAQCAFSFYNLAVLDNVAEGMLSEVVDYFTAALEGGHTPRTMRVIAAGAVVYGARVTPPVWAFE
jgi:hypothetical protein